MPYIELPDSWLDAGSPTKEEIFQTIKANQEGFNTDIEALKQVSQFDIIDVSVSGEIENYTNADITPRMPVFRAPVAGSITSVVIALLASSTSGTLEMTIEKSVDNGANWSPLLSSPVQLTGLTAGSVSGAVNFINAAAQDFDQNDLLRIDFPNTQVGQGTFHVSLYGELGA